jgi:hypothetical protein
MIGWKKRHLKMPSYKVYQMKLTDEQVDEINEQGAENSSLWRFYNDANMFPDGDKVQNALRMGLYDHMANIEAPDMNQVVHLGDTEFEVSDKIEFLENKFGRQMHTITIGDVIEDPDGQKWFVNFGGYEKV